MSNSHSCLLTKSLIKSNKIASSDFSIPLKKAATPLVKESKNQHDLDIILGPDMGVDKDPCLHEPDSIRITFLDRLDHSVGTGLQVFWIHRFGLFIRQCSLSYIHLHKQITIVKM